MTRSEHGASAPDGCPPCASNATSLDTGSWWNELRTSVARRELELWVTASSTEGHELRTGSGLEQEIESLIRPVHLEEASLSPCNE